MVRPRDCGGRGEISAAVRLLAPVMFDDVCMQCLCLVGYAIILYALVLQKYLLEMCNCPCYFALRVDFQCRAPAK